MCWMSLTVVVRTRWKGDMTRPAMSSAGRPVYCQTTAMTGMRISGKMSTGVREHGQPTTNQNEQRQHDEGVWPLQCDSDESCHSGLPFGILARPRRLGYQSGHQNRPSFPTRLRREASPLEFKSLVRFLAAPPRHARGLLPHRDVPPVPGTRPKAAHALGSITDLRQIYLAWRLICQTICSDGIDQIIGYIDLKLGRPS